ncbi:MAG: hypothetical protein ACI9LX_003100 [Paraglaciecola sp.]|jgi:hypothetical protein
MLIAGRTIQLTTYDLEVLVFPRPHRWLIIINLHRAKVVYEVLEKSR